MRESIKRLLLSKNVDDAKIALSLITDEEILLTAANHNNFPNPDPSLKRIYVHCQGRYYLWREGEFLTTGLEAQDIPDRIERFNAELYER